MGWATQYIAMLRDGKTVQFRPRGNSMTGLIETGQLCTVEPNIRRSLVSSNKSNYPLAPSTGHLNCAQSEP